MMQPKPSILVVDDLDENIQLIELALKQLEVNIIRAHSGHEALEKIRGVNLAVALIDIQMPIMGGPELAARIQQERAKDLVPVIFITAYPVLESDYDSFYKEGIIDFIIKPFHRKVLARKVKLLLDLYIQKQRVTDSEKKYRTLVNASPEGVVILDINGHILEMSTVALRIFNLGQPDQYRGMHFTALFPPGEHDHLHRLISQTLNEGIVQGVEFDLIRSDGSNFFGELSITRIPEGTSEPRNLMTIIRDVTRRKDLEQQLIRSEKLAGLGEMAAGIAHEINQPLNIISIGLENLLNELGSGRSISPEYLKKKASRIFENISRIDFIIDNVRTFSRIQQDTNFDDFSVNDSIRNSLELIAGPMKQKGISVILDLDPSHPTVRGNTFKFEQVMVNLLANARDAIDEMAEVRPGTVKTVKVCSTSDDASCQVTVADTGIGVLPNEADKIMLPFHTLKGPGKGTGLGLSISYGIIREMNGTLDFSSEHMAGTTFRIVLPRSG